MGITETNRNKDHYETGIKINSGNARSAQNVLPCRPLLKTLISRVYETIILQVVHESCLCA